MKKVLSFILIACLTITFMGLNNVAADEAASTDPIATDFDTTLDEDVVVYFDSAFGLESWANEYTATAIAATSDGGYIVGGSVVTDGWSWIHGEIIKYDANFDVEFTISLEDDWWTFINAIEQDSNGDYWVFTTDENIDDNGTTEDESDDIYTYPRVLLKIDGTTQAVTGTYNSTTANAADDWSAEWEANSIVELSNGNILLVSVKDGDVFFEIIDPSTMTMVTSGSYGSTHANDNVKSIQAAADPAGGFYLTAGIGAIDGFFAASGLTMKGDQDAVVTKFDNAGAEVWTTQLGSTGGWNYGNAVAYHDGHVYVAGETWGTKDLDFATLTDQGGSDAFVAKLDSTTGAVVWVENFGGTGYENFTDLDVDATGVYAGGYSDSKDGDLLFAAGIVDGNFVMKLDLDGGAKAAALHHSRFDDSGGNAGIYGVDLLANGELVYAASMGYWVNLAGSFTSNEHKYENNSYNFDNPLGTGTWGAKAAGTAVLNFGVDTTGPTIIATPTIMIPIGYSDPTVDGIMDDFGNDNRMNAGYVGTYDVNTAGTYNITLNAEDYYGNAATDLAQEIIVYSELNGMTVDTKAVTNVMPDLVLVKDGEYTCGMAGVDVQIAGETLEMICWLPDTGTTGATTVYYRFSNAMYEIQTSRELEIILSVMTIEDGAEVYDAQEVRVPHGYTVTVDGVAAADGDMITDPGVHVVVINDGTADETITFEIFELAAGVTDKGVYADETTIVFDDTTYTAELDGVAFTTGTKIDVWGHYEIVFTEIANPTNMITMNFIIGDAIYKDLFEHGVLIDSDYMVDGSVTKLNGSQITSDGGYIVVGEQDGAIYIAKYLSTGVLDFELTYSSDGDDVGVDVAEISPGRYAVLADVWDLTGDFAATSIAPYQNGEGDWYTYRVLLDIAWDGSAATMDAWNGTDIEHGVVAGSYNYIRTARVEYDPIDEVLYVINVLDQWSFPILEAYGSHDLYLAQFSVDADSFDFEWYRTFGSTDWDRVGRMDGYAAPLAVVPGVGVVTGYASKQSDGTIVTEADKLLTSSTPWYDDGDGGAYESAIVIMVNNDGTTDWIKTMAGNNALFFLDVEVDAAGNIYVGGVHHSNVEPDVWTPYGDFGAWVDNASTDYTGSRDFFVAKLDSDGETIWLEVAGTKGNDELKDIAVDSNGNVYFVGYTDESNAPGGDSVYGSRLANTRTVIGKITADGKLIAFENYNSEELSMFNSMVILADDSVVAFGLIKVDAGFMQSQTDFEITSVIDGLSSFVGLKATFEFLVDMTIPTVTSVPELVVEEGLGSLALINHYTNTIFQELKFAYADAEDMPYLMTYEVTGTVDFDTPGTYTLSFVAYDMRMNPSATTDLVVHVVAEAANEDGTITLDGTDFVVAGMGSVTLDMADDNTTFVYDAGTVTVTGETLVKSVYDENDTMFDIAVPGVYDIIEVFANENYFIILDREIKLLGGLVGIEEGVTYTTAVAGNFAGTATLNGEAYVAGTMIEEAGNHVIVLTEFVGATPITVNFTITSGVNIVDDSVYDRTQTPIFRGTATLNGDAFTSGTDIVTPGGYTLVITGPGAYTETYEFDLTSGVNIDDADELDDTVIVTFRGTATLNGEVFTSGTEILLPGTYVLVITGLGSYTETINFTVVSGMTGVTDGAEIDSGTAVTIWFNTGTATLSLDGFPADAYTSGTRIEADGAYVLRIMGIDGHLEIYRFRIGEEPDPVCSDGYTLTDGECVKDPIVCEDGFNLEDGECVEEEKTGCFSSVGFGSSMAVSLTALGAGLFLIIKRRFFAR